MQIRKYYGEKAKCAILEMQNKRHKPLSSPSPAVLLRIPNTHVTE